jgi:hypothetical protein
VETQHPEGGQSPFVVKDDDASIAAMISMADEDVRYASCPVEGCGEKIRFTELDSHIEMHEAEEQGQEDSDIESESEPEPKKPKLGEGIQQAFGTKLSYALRNLDDSEKSSPEPPPSDRQAKAKPQWKDILKMPETASSSKSKAGASSTAATKSPRRRLGVSLSSVLELSHHVIPTFYFQKSELGPHANEKQMPQWLVKLLENDGKMETINRLGRDNKLFKVKVCVNQASGILPVVEQLLDMDPHTDFAYLCHPVVKHVSKLRGEGKLKAEIWIF